MFNVKKHYRFPHTTIMENDEDETTHEDSHTLER